MIIGPVSAAAALVMLAAAPAFAQNDGPNQQWRPHHANYAAEAQYPRPAEAAALPTDRSLQPYHRPHHAE